MDIQQIETYINHNGFPMIRRCMNCLHWEKLKPHTSETNSSNSGRSGFCKLNPLYFAYTLEPSVFPLTKEYFLCVSHQFKNEYELSHLCEKKLMIEVLKKKEELD
jgi:hypothetical protein